MKLKNELETLKVAYTTIADISDVFREYFKNTNEPLEERWTFFEEAHNMMVVKTDGCFTGHMFKDEEITPFDDLYMDRGSITDTLSVIANLTEEKEFSEEFINNFKEEILKHGYTHLECDW